MAQGRIVFPYMLWGLLWSGCAQSQDWVSLSGGVFGTLSPDAMVCVDSRCEPLGDDGTYVVAVPSRAELMVCFHDGAAAVDCVPVVSQLGDLHLDWQMTPTMGRRVAAALNDSVLDNEQGHLQVWILGATGGVNGVSLNAQPPPSIGPLYPTRVPGSFGPSTTGLGLARWVNGPVGPVWVEPEEGFAPGCTVALGWPRDHGVAARLVAGATTTVAVMCR